MKNKLLFFGVLFACLIAFTPKVYALDYDNALFDNLPQEQWGGNFTIQYQVMYIYEDEIYLYQFASENTFTLSGEVNHETNEVLIMNFLQTSSVNPTTSLPYERWGYYNQYKYDFDSSSWKQIGSGYIYNGSVFGFNVSFPNRLIWSDFTLNTTSGETFFSCSSQDINSCIGIGSSSPGGGDTEEDEDESILSTIKTWFTDLINSIIELPSKFVQVLKDIFVPDVDSIKFAFNEMLLKIETRLGIDNSGLNSLNNVQEKPLENVHNDYYLYGVGTLNLKFLDVSYLKQGIDYFRPIIKGFIVLLLLFYNYKMILSFIGQDNGSKGSDKE